MLVRRMIPMRLVGVPTAVSWCELHHPTSGAHPRHVGWALKLERDGVVWLRRHWVRLRVEGTKPISGRSSQVASAPQQGRAA